MVGVVIIILGALVVFAIAAAFVGSEAFRLGHQPETAVFDIDEAVEAVADRLDDIDAARLTHDEVRTLIGFSLEHLRSYGVSAMPGEDPTLGPEGPPVVVDDDVAVAVVMGRADDVGLDVGDRQVLAVLDGLLAHLHDIGAVGPVVDGPIDPTDPPGPSEKF